LRKRPPNSNQNEQERRGRQEELSLKRKGSKQKEDDVGDSAKNEVENEVNQPVIRYLHTIHLHHLDQLLLLLQNQPVKHHGKQEAQGYWEDEGRNRVNNVINKSFWSLGVAGEDETALVIQSRASRASRNLAKYVTIGVADKILQS